MKSLPVLALLHLSTIACGQATFFNPAAGNASPPREIAIIKPAYLPGYASYYFTYVYNDLFHPAEGRDKFEIPPMDFYKQKKVAQVKISDYGGEPKFILDIGPSGLPAKTTTYSNLLLEDQLFYDEAGINNLTVKSYSKEGYVIRVDSVYYSRQKKVINDTVYAYQVIRTRVYKTGRFLNEQNAYYNEKKYYPGMLNNPFGITTAIVWTTKKKGNKKTTKQRYASQPEKFPCNYHADQLYFSRGYINVDEHTFTFHGNVINPGEKGLEMYVPEFALQAEIQQSDLACEQFDEPRTMQRSYICGYGMQSMQEHSLIQNSIYYTYSQNANGLQDTCYSNIGNEKRPIYHFNYSYYE